MNKRQRKKAAKRQAEKEIQIKKEKAQADFNEACKRLYEAVLAVGNEVGKALVEAANVINAEIESGDWKNNK